MSGSAPIAALPMYEFPEIAAANDALWSGIALRLRARGVPAPAGLARGADVARLWRDPGLVFGHTCGYPYAKELSDAVVLIATPEYCFPGCDGAAYRSFLICRKHDPRRLDAFRGGVAAVNAWDSNSGMNLFRAAIAPHADGRPFFASVILTGSHQASLAAVAAGGADLAAVDCVTFALLQRLRPALVERVTVHEGGQAIVGSVNAPTPGGGAANKTGEQPHALAYAPGVETPRQIEAERPTVPSAGGARI